MECKKTENNTLKSVVDLVGFLLFCLFAVAKSLVLLALPDSYRSQKNVKGEVVVITGGGGGLGRLIALRLAKLDAVVVLWDVNIEGVEETVSLVKGIGGTAYGYKCDIANKEEVYKIAKRTSEEVGEVSILINNAGVVSGGLLLDTPDRLIQRTFDVNVLAHFWTVKAFLPKMIEKNRGHVVSIASMAGFVGIRKLVDYCSSKFAVVGFSEALRVELEAEGVDGVKTTTVCPYFIRQTGMFHRVNSRYLSSLKNDEVADRVVEALRKEEVLVMIPHLFNIGIVLKLLFPWECVSMFLRGLVPDAVPCDEPSIPSSKTCDPIPKSKLTMLQNQAVVRSNGVDGKNL